MRAGGALVAGAKMAGVAALLFVALASGFFLLVGASPAPVLAALVEGAFGSGYALSESLVKATPILLCGLATLLPARLGLISVGAEGQLAAGAVAGTWLVLAAGSGAGRATLAAGVAAAALGGAALGAVVALLRARLGANETIGTLLLNYLPPLLIEHLVYGPWKDPASLGWPATVTFPDAARVPVFGGTRVHLGLVLGVALVLLAHAALARTRWGFALDLLRGSPPLAARSGLRFGPAALVVMALGGACAGVAGFADASALEGRLQVGVAVGAGYSGFLVAWLARGRVLWLLPLALLVGGLRAAGDNLQLTRGLPSATELVMQALLFASALVADRGRRAPVVLPGATA